MDDLKPAGSDEIEEAIQAVRLFMNRFDLNSLEYQMAQTALDKLVSGQQKNQEYYRWLMLGNLPSSYQDIDEDSDLE